MGSISGLLLEGFFDVFSGLCRVKKLPKYGWREQNALWRFGSYLLSILSHNAKSMAGAILEGHLRTQKNMFFRCFLGTVFLHFHKKQPNPIFLRWRKKGGVRDTLLGALWEPSGHLWETFGDQGGPKAPKSVPNATQRLQDSPKRLRKNEMARLSREV